MAAAVSVVVCRVALVAVFKAVVTAVVSVVVCNLVVALVVVVNFRVGLAVVEKLVFKVARESKKFNLATMADRI